MNGLRKEGLTGCSHLHIIAFKGYTADGTNFDRWECRDCRMVFIPSKLVEHNLTEKENEIKILLANHKADEQTIREMRESEDWVFDMGWKFCEKGWNRESSLDWFKRLKKETVEQKGSEQ